MHTPEPWKYNGEEDGDFVVWGPAPDNGFIGNIGSDFKEMGVIIDLDRDNAKRVVACVNACWGIGTESLERFNEDHKPKNGFGIHRESSLEAQRDELLAALKELIEVIKEDCVMEDSKYDLLGIRINAAIAKCEQK